MKFKYTANIQMTATIEIEAKTPEEADGFAVEWYERLEPSDGMHESGSELIRANPSYSEIRRYGL